MTSKLRRWIDLLGALLRRHYPITLEEICREVPGYPNADHEAGKAARRRMFERDKRELRGFGIPLETVDVDDPPGTKAYRLRAKDFYLPYLSLLGGGRRPGAPIPGRYGYRSLPSLCFEPDELSAVALAAARAERLGVAALAADARSAVRKLGHDMPVEPEAADDGVRHLARRTAAEEEVFDALSDALARRKQVTFSYHSIGRDTTGRRTVEPYGLCYLGNHWYLAAVAPGEGLVKKFRLSRIAEVAPNPAKPDSPDYEIPRDFDLKAHAESQHAWELGSGDVTEVLVQVTAPAGSAFARLGMGDPVGGDPTARRFRVRRVDAFVRWILGAGGTVIPVAPPEVVAAFRTQLDGARARYRTPA